MWRKRPRGATSTKFTATASLNLIARGIETSGRDGRGPVRAQALQPFTAAVTAANTSPSLTLPCRSKACSRGALLCPYWVCILSTARSSPGVCLVSTAMLWSGAVSGMSTTAGAPMPGANALKVRLPTNDAVRRTTKSSAPTVMTPPLTSSTTPRNTIVFRLSSRGTSPATTHVLTRQRQRPISSGNVTRYRECCLAPPQKVKMELAAIERMFDRATVVRRATYVATQAALAMEAVAPMSR